MEKFIIGSYSDSKTSIDNAHGKGLSILSLENEKLFIVSNEERIINPSYLFKNKENQIISCSEFFTKDGLITIYDCDKKIKIKEIDSKGKATCFVNFDEKTKNLFWANYLSGNIGLYNIESENVDLFEFSGFSITKDRQESPHPHCLIINEKYLFVSDLGCDKIYIFDRFSENFNLVDTIDVPKGYGPRHLVYLYNRLFVLCELKAKLLSYSFNDEKKTWTLEEDKNNECDLYMNKSNPAAIKVIEKEDYSIISTSNRFSDGLRVFKVSKDGTLKFIKDLRLKGKNPRDFGFSKDNKYLLVALQDSDCIELYRVNEKGIVEDELVSILKINTPVCVINY